MQHCVGRVGTAEYYSGTIEVMLLHNRVYSMSWRASSRHELLASF